MNKRELINNEMKLLAEYITTKSIDMSSIEGEDGRITSAVKEADVLEVIKEYYKDKENIELDVPKIRNWYDYAIVIKNAHSQEIFVPVNIKLPKLTSNSGDNSSSIDGLVWTFYNDTEGIKGSGKWSNMKKIIDKYDESHISRVENDYYYLVIDKENSNTVFFNSIKQITEVKKNSNNLPFQIVWKNNMKPIINQDALSAYVKTFGKFVEGVYELQKRIDAFENSKKILESLNKDAQ